MGKKEFEEFNLEKNIKNKINSINSHKQLIDINNEIENLKKSGKSDFIVRGISHKEEVLKRIKGNILDNNYSKPNDFEIDNYISNKTLFISEVNKKFNKYSFYSNENVNELSITKSILQDFTYSGNTNIKNINIFDSLFIKSNTIGFNDKILQKLNIGYSSKIFKNESIFLHNFSISEILIQSNGVRGKLNTKIDFVSIKDNKVLNNLLIDNIKISELILENINNNFDSFEIRNCKIDKLIIRNSNLGKAVFNGVEIGKLEIENATLNDCIFNGVDFKVYELEEIKKGDYVDYKKMKDNYRQLKHVMDKNGNHTEANEFYSLEMEYYRLYLTNGNYKKGLLQNLTNNFFGTNIENSGKYLILNFLGLINNFGNNIYRNIYTIYLYLFLVILISFVSNDYTKSDILYSIEFTQLLRFITLILMIYSIPVLFSIFLKKIKKDNIIVKIDNFISSTNFTIILHIIIALFLLFLLNIDINRYHGIETFIYLINPFSGLTPNSMSHLLWSEQLGMIIHKIIYGILIYQLIIALKRTTKR